LENERFGLQVNSLRRCVVSARVIRVEEQKSKRGNLQVHFDDWRIVGEVLVEQEEDDEAAHANDEEKEHRHEILLDWLDKQGFAWKGLRVLDAGGGAGALSRLLIQRGCEVVLVDPRKRPVEKEPFERVVGELRDDLVQLEGVGLVLAMHAGKESPSKCDVDL
jgi:2-polyprenyl-3-methyl-5-hydroxy-6-metoxy-1,4-benzoquinol methylase